MYKSWLAGLGFLVTLTLGNHVHAQTRSQVYGSTLDKQTQTAYVSADVGWMTYQSEAAESNAAGQSVNYTIGAFAGESRHFGVSLNSSESKISFDLNNSSIKTVWNDIRGQARLGWFYPTIIATSSEIKIQRRGENLADMYASGVGGGMSMHIPITERIIAFAEGLQVHTPRGHDKSGRDIEVGPRTQFDAGTSIDITNRAVDLILGYRYRDFQIKTEEDSFNEVQTAGYAGLRLGIYF